MGSESEVVRRQAFDVTGPVEVDVALVSGRVLVHLVDEEAVDVELRHEPSGGDGWTDGLNGLLSWVGDQFAGGKGGPAGGSGGVAEAVRDARLELTGNRLVIRSSKALPLRAVPISVAVRAPKGSSVLVKSGSANVAITGGAGRLDINTGTGDVTADSADSASQVTSGSGKVRLGPMLGGVKARNGSGDVEVAAVSGSSEVHTATGDVWLGAVQSDVQVRTGGGDVTVADAASGRITLGTGSGDVRVGVRQGVAAEVDLASTSGTARSELEVSTNRPAQAPDLVITGRTSRGNALVTTAAG
ncbi:MULTISPECIES: DUF4097 family beta strand repeat-containing protein [Actinosynnema]|uniref:DUF4097 family beta strand repeat-containing protein n=1 Tax=Actinosynnema TaxID=40566 RepID=UPI0020A5070C|nr:DUF4097 family beta strand repeat-containing protein [Actinosynnema pretiosum]MCP2094079.1 putative adhesin [Actinosynnema pretiosum]